MDRKFAGLLGAVGAIVSAGPGLAAPAVNVEQAMHAESYADLLRPIPNARATLQAADAAVTDGSAAVVLVQFHHHHHHRYRRRYHRHHHHHSMMAVPAPKPA